MIGGWEAQLYHGGSCSLNLILSALEDRKVLSEGVASSDLIMQMSPFGCCAQIGWKGSKNRSGEIRRLLPTPWQEIMESWIRASAIEVIQDAIWK